MYFTQRVEAGRQGSQTSDRGVGLGQDVPERFHGIAVVRDIGADQVAGGRMVQAVDARGGRVLQRARARGRRRFGRAQKSNAGKLLCYVLTRQTPLYSDTGLSSSGGGGSEFGNFTSITSDPEPTRIYAFNI